MTPPKVETVTTKDSREPVVCPARTPLCPSCGKPLRRVHPLSGSVIVTCEARVSHKGERTRCGQHVYLTAAGDGLCLSLAITKAEATAVRRDPGYGHSALTQTLYAKLGAYSDLVEVEE